MSFNIRPIKKVLRFVGMYGVRRTLLKTVGRTRFPVSLVWRRYRSPDIALIGCGQFGMTAIGYFITKRFGRRIKSCFDINEAASNSCKKVLGIERVSPSFDDAVNNQNIKFVYIASNHASHTDYACRSMLAGKTVYVEKPVSVSLEQFKALRETKLKTGQKLFAGYNRPFSGAIKKIKSHTISKNGPISLNCAVSGHIIAPDHWYRDPEEGTRICGNAGHWIDLFIHLLSWRKIPNTFTISILSAKVDEPDDNFVLSISTDFGDVFSLMLTARTEPFEGINETINLQWDDLIAKIDDFRRLTIWQDVKKRTYSFWPKDVGHECAILQPFEHQDYRDWHEIEVSTLLMLTCMNMINDGAQTMTVNIDEKFKMLDMIP